MLGPHVVGQRIVVRRVLRGETGPSGGPALTDLLGTCPSWTATSCVVQPENGAPVEIALADIVSGKPVPPRPSVRHRVSPLEAQTRSHGDVGGPRHRRRRRLGAAALGDLAGTPRQLRCSPSSPRASRTTTSASSTGTPSRTGRPIAAVLPDSPRRRSSSAAGGGRRATTPTPSSSWPAWHACAAPSPGRRRHRGRGLRRSRRRPPGRRPDRRPGLGVATFDRDWVGLRTIEVAPDRRRQGLGRRVVAALLEWGAEQGATTAYLQVLGDNAPALGLYEGSAHRAPPLPLPGTRGLSRRAATRRARSRSGLGFLQTTVSLGM